ncbi:MAG: bifunctional riboflavin kinase/FAD synthetase [Candidatus Caenarcaniphilales bacterium]|nr:bifunctional riboflavin kinase/FAD synthetase [Candidatus Caenarcaniphilales bacterium]
MQLFNLKTQESLSEPFADLSESSVALGMFDGVHLGHQEIIIAAVNKAKASSLIPSVLTFKNHPRSLTINRCPKIITNFATRLDLFAEYGIEQVLALNFSLDIMYMLPEDYLNKYLQSILNTKAISVGYDHHFGRNREGNPDFLAKWTEANNIDLDVVQAFKYQSELISSSRIRELITEGQISAANQYLGHGFSLSGLVIKGDQRGRTIGFPTANLKIDDDLILPANGVYLVDAYIRKAALNKEPWGKANKALVNIGFRPSFKSEEKISVEVHILDFDENIYGEEMKIVFQDKLRDEQKFDSAEALIAQIHQDIAAVKRLN